MKAAPQGHGSRWYLWLVVAVLAGLWLAAGSVSAVSPAGNETGDKVAPHLASAPVAIHLPLSSGLASPAETPASALVAHVTWQGIGQPNHRNTTETLTLTLRLNSGGPLVTYPSIATDASGFFTVSVDSLPAGTYNYQAKGFRNLAQGGQVALAGDPVTNVEMGLMAAGDASNNNVVDSTDFAILRSTFGHPFCWCSTYNARADFNNTDNVDSTDFSLLKGNFGHGGAPPVSP